MFMFDIETLGTESTSIILSAAITHFDFDDVKIRNPQDERAMLEEYRHYVNSSKVVKFDVREQKDNGRIYTKGSVDWWKKQSQIAKDTSLTMREDDLSVKEGIRQIQEYVDAHGGNNQIVWARGSLDQMAFDSLCRSIDMEPIFMYNMWRDVRTAIDILATESKGGYADIKNFNANNHVIKHVPQNDCALDILMVLYYV